MTDERSRDRGSAPADTDLLELAPERRFPEEERQKGFWTKLKRGLTMTHTELIEKVSAAMEGRATLDEETLEFLEEALIGADLGVETSLELVDNLRRDVKPGQAIDVLQLRQRLVDEMSVLLLDAPGRRSGARRRAGRRGSPWWSASTAWARRRRSPSSPAARSTPASGC